MIDYYLANQDQAGEGVELLPGVQPLLEALARRGDVAVCLVTGNLEPIGCACPGVIFSQHSTAQHACACPCFWAVVPRASACSWPAPALPC